MAGKSERLAVLSNAEQFALYGLPDFDEGQRLEYLCLSQPELALASGCRDFRAQVYCALQIGYFKAKNAFFRRAQVAAAREMWLKELKTFLRDRPLGCGELCQGEHAGSLRQIPAQSYDNDSSNHTSGPCSEALKLQVSRPGLS